MSYNHSPKIITNGLVLYLDAANSKSYTTGSTWVDLSRNGNDATLSVSGTSFISSSIVFDGVSGTVGCTGTNTMPTGTHTVEFVYYNSSSTNTYPTLYSRVGQQTAAGYWWCYTNGGVNTGLSWQYSTTSNTLGTLSIANATQTLGYVHGSYVIDYENQTFQYYKNGVLFGTSVLPYNIRPVSSSNNLYIGTYQGSTGVNGYNLRGNLPIFKLYNRALTDSEIWNNFCAVRSRYGI